MIGLVCVKTTVITVETQKLDKSWGQGVFDISLSGIRHWVISVSRMKTINHVCYVDSNKMLFHFTLFILRSKNIFMYSKNVALSHVLNMFLYGGH